MRFYPFFLECSKRETDKENKRYLELLGFGKCGMIIDNDDGTSTLVKEKGTFKIPITYSVQMHDELNQMLWTKNNEFEKLEATIKESMKQWVNVKKRDQLRLIDKYVLKLECDMKEKKYRKGAITTAFLLGMIKPNDIVYQDFEIKHINTIFSKAFTNNGSGQKSSSRRVCEWDAAPSLTFRKYVIS
ncbi:hypothetical protein DPMN_026772 [Dreissena polymorpha]|uniref:Uncharacterized protein n=1 Tax=Dreissena polymorpha TaxID=45954 RepID=A0A9D4LU09_DREPO|nr:hypothetical protein DPMN_026772 [Dreissena polymorpha]